MTEQLYRPCWRSYDEVALYATPVFRALPRTIAECYELLMALKADDAKDGGHADYWIEPA